MRVTRHGSVIDFELPRFQWQRYRGVFILITSTFAALAIALAIWLNRMPVGYFDSTSILGHHDKEDVLEVAYGTVTWRTCCGDTEAGTFSRQPDGQWIWNYTQGNKSRSRATVVIEPGLLWLACHEVGKPDKVWKLRRRLIAPDSEEFGRGKRSQAVTFWSVLSSFDWLNP